jgi:hypothetical protein
LDTSEKSLFIKSDALKQICGFVWMNPPFSEGKPWHEKFAAHGDGICLVPMAKSYWYYERVKKVRPDVNYDDKAK